MLAARSCGMVDWSRSFAARRAPSATDARVDERGRKPHRSGEGLTAGPIIGDDGNAGGIELKILITVKSLARARPHQRSDRI